MQLYEMSSLALAKLVRELRGQCDALDLQIEDLRLDNRRLELELRDACAMIKSLRDVLSMAPKGEGGGPLGGPRGIVR